MKKLLLFLMVGVITFTVGFLSFGESAKAAMPVQKTKWVVEKKESKPVTYGSWTTLLERNSGTSGSITIKFSKERSNSYSGSIAGSKKDFSAQVGFDVTKKSTVAVDDLHTGLSKKKTYLAQYRTRTLNYKVTQRMYCQLKVGGPWYKSKNTQVVNVKKQDGFNTRVKAK
ncbi:hypothetical protein AF829_12865 [Listeria monocytogenes]|uniref:hypothetical protein n=1 Tax=Listeria monocytogenes TaxID=1639 RepID=UPI00086D5125|nr:hypothetical protein [Listeria monocytogenes]EAD7568623.1 hypothetical protein [Listeria monocytogenes]EAG6742572.1 hypothetical protein [Listeria monocytogenes]EBF6196025.1 hypothetical protein [Listeria monocytogenes]OEQ27763.1 hypothetical protein AJN14_04780 [Listeria monocytogenes]